MRISSAAFYIRKGCTVMEINNLQSSIINAYKKVSEVTHSGGKASSVKRQNTDKVEFDFSRSIGAAKANIASRLDAETNTSRIEELQKAYAGDNCPVSGENIAEAIFSAV